MERTLSIIKPNAIKRKLEGQIISKIENNGFEIVAQKKLVLSKKQAELFYREHSEKPFFEGLVDFMCSGSIVVQVLERENAVVSYRTLMGATDPKNAEKGTIRREFGESIRENAVHGSENLESACREIHFFFSDIEFIYKY